MRICFNFFLALSITLHAYAFTIARLPLADFSEWRASSQTEHERTSHPFDCKAVTETPELWDGKNVDELPDQGSLFLNVQHWTCVAYQLSKENLGREVKMQLNIHGQPEFECDTFGQHTQNWVVIGEVDKVLFRTCPRPTFQEVLSSTSIHTHPIPVE